MNVPNIEQKIRELEGWLQHNPDNNNRSLIEQDLRKLKELKHQTTQSNEI